MYNYLKVGSLVLDTRLATYTNENVHTPFGSETIMANLSYDTKIRRTYFRPKLNYKFGIMDIETYRTFLEIINQDSFQCEYYDYELGENVFREFKVDSRTISRLQVAMSDIQSVGGITVSFESLHGYLSYDDMRANKPAYTY